MYKSPIEIICGQMQMKVEDDIYKAVQEYDIKVDKEELIKALHYDRFQYSRGYLDGRADAMDEVIRCQNCQYSEPCKPYNKVWCPKIGRYMKQDGFCSEGVMKDA